MPLRSLMRAPFLPLLAVPFAWASASVVPTRASQPSTVAIAAPQRPSATAACPGPTLGGRCLPSPNCGPQELDLDGLCVPAGADPADEAPTESAENAHVDRSGRRVVYEHLPRRQDLPADYDLYRYPVPPGNGNGHSVSSGYDLDRPDSAQRRGEHLSAVGHGGVDLPQERGTLVRVVSLRGEVGEPEVVFVGTLFGNTVILRHVVREGAALRTYLALHGHLEGAAPGISRGVTLTPGAVLGYVGDSGALGIVHLHYEVRLVRPGVDPMRVDPPSRLVEQAVSIPCDPRNVLPLRGAS